MVRRRSLTSISGVAVTGSLCMISRTFRSPSVPPREASALSSSWKVSMPTIRPCSITTSEPRFSFAMVATASATRPPGSMLSNRFPLTRRISFTCMALSPRSNPGRKSLVQTPLLGNVAAQHHLEGEHAVALAARLRGLDVVPDHGLDGEPAVLGARQVVAQLGGGDLRDVLVLGDRGDLLVAQAGQGDTIFEGNHCSVTASRAPGSAERTAIVTGGARGIGKAIAERLAALGWRVAVADIAGGSDFLFVRTDISREPSVRACVRAVLRRFGRL